MGFEWVQDISVGAATATIAGALAIEEIRTNVDTVDNEKCAAHKVSHDADHKDGDDTTYNPGYQSDYKDGDETSNNPGYYGNHNDTYKSSDHPEVLNTYRTTVYHIYNSVVKGYN